MAAIIAIADLPSAIQSHELVAVMVDAANAKASRVAPCLTWDGTVADQPAPTADQLAEAKLVLIGMVKRWTESGAGALEQQTAGPFGMTVDTRQRTGYHPWPSEIEALQAICATAETSGAFSIDTVGTGGTAAGHADSCALNFGALYCSCGYVLTQELPLYGA